MIALLASPGMSRPLQEVAAVFQAAGIKPHYVILGAGSESFIFEANRLRQPDGRLLPALIDKYAPGTPTDEPVVFFGYSAGCWLARDGILVNAQDRAQTAGVIYNDGLHANESQLATTRTYLAEGGKVLVIHSDVVPGGYPSTTDTAKRLGSHPNLTTIHAPGDHTWTSLGAPAKVQAWLAGPFRSGGGATEPDVGGGVTPGPGGNAPPGSITSESSLVRSLAFAGGALAGFSVAMLALD